MGETFAQGVCRLKAAGEPVFRVKVTSPPGALGGIGELRIIREKIYPQGKEWLLAYPAYFRKLNENAS